MAYTAQSMRRRQQGFWDARECGGYFDRVVALHPIADRAVEGMVSNEVHRLSARQIQIQGRAMACELPKFLAPLNFWLSQRALFHRLYHHFADRGVSVIYATDPVYGGLFGHRLARKLKRPLVVAVWGNWDEQWANTRTLAMPRLVPSKRLQDAIIRYVLRSADHVVVGNNNNLNYVLDHGAHVDRASVVSTSKFLFAGHFSDPDGRRKDAGVLQELGLPPGAKPLICVGRLVSEKLPDQALDVLIKAARLDGSVYGLMAGEGPLRAALENRISAEGLGSRVKLVGALSQHTLARLLPHCIVISPLTGMALIEAGLAGSPIVAYDHEWQAEFIEHGRTGFLVPFGDTDAMAERSLQLFRDADLAASFSRAIRIHAVSVADRDAIFASEQAMFDRVIERYEAEKRD